MGCDHAPLLWMEAQATAAARRFCQKLGDVEVNCRVSRKLVPEGGLAAELGVFGVDVFFVPGGLNGFE